MKTDAERARDARGFGDHLADHLFSAGQADRLRELVACLMPLCYLQEDALRAEHAFDEALERASASVAGERHRTHRGGRDSSACAAAGA
jgi:hypothetical protein